MEPINMGPKHPGCEAVLQTNAFSEVTVPVCMGGAALRGVLDSIVGCDNAVVCSSQLRVEPGMVNYLTVEGNRVLGHAVIKQNVSIATNADPRPLIAPISNPPDLKRDMLPANWIVGGLA